VEQFLFIAGHPALDFLNTEKRNDAGEVVDLINTPERLTAWLATAGFDTLPADGFLLADAHALRDAIRALVTAWTDADSPAPEAARERLNQILGTGASYPVLATNFAALRERVTVAPSPLLPIADTAYDLFAHHDRNLVRRCGGTGCVLWFLDTTKNKRRRWCRMEVCGNRMKVAAHYQRHHDSAE
jgi:predicted RNA-binding Zn ribbon-like protein